MKRLNNFLVFGKDLEAGFVPKLFAKKLCHLTYHPPYDTRIFHKECKTLVNAGYGVTLLVPHNQSEFVDGVKIVPLPIYRTRLAKFVFLPFKAFLFALRQKASIYHFHDPALIISGLLLKAFGKKVIYDVHEDYKSKILSKHYIPRFLRRPLAYLFDLFEKNISKVFDAIVVVDDYLQSRFRHRRVVKVANFPPIIEIPRQKQNDEFVFVYAGGISKDRGISKVIQALDFLGDYRGKIKIILAGPIEEKDIKQAVENNPLIDYVGYLPWREVLKIYSVSDVGLLLLQPVPAYIYITTETPVKLFEYMLAGLAVLSTDFPSFKKLIEGNKCGICVDSTSPREIADAMKYLIEHKEEARKMGENGRRAVIERYNWEKESEKLLKLYKELLRER